MESVAFGVTYTGYEGRRKSCASADANDGVRCRVHRPSLTASRRWSAGAERADNSACGARKVVVAGGSWVGAQPAGSSWDAALMIVSLLYRATRGLLSVPAVLLRRDTAKDAELLVLRHERRQVNGRARRPVLVGCVVVLAAAPLLEQRPGHSGDAVGLAPRCAGG